MAVPSDNSALKSFKSLLSHTGEGIVVDIGTGDGRFVSAAARANPNKFYIGIDANVKPLKKISMKATRKPAKGGLPNALFVQAAVEDLPEELNGVADEIHIHFPWGSLLQAVALGNASILASLQRVCTPGCLLEIVIGIDRERDKTEIERLELPELSSAYLNDVLIPKYEAAGFEVLDHGSFNDPEWSRLETSWVRKLRGNPARGVVYLIARSISEDVAF